MPLCFQAAASNPERFTRQRTQLPLVSTRRTRTRATRATAALRNRTCTKCRTEISGSRCASKVAPSCGQSSHLVLTLRDETSPVHFHDIISLPVDDDLCFAAVEANGAQYLHLQNVIGSISVKNYNVMLEYSYTIIDLISGQSA